MAAEHYFTSTPDGDLRPRRISARIAGRDLEVTTGRVTYAGTNGVPQRDVVILTVEDGEPAFTEAFQPSFVP